MPASINRVWNEVTGKADTATLAVSGVTLADDAYLILAMAKDGSLVSGEAPTKSNFWVKSESFSSQGIAMTIWTANFAKNSVSSQIDVNKSGTISGVRCLCMGNNGTKLYTLVYNTGILTEYNLTTAYDVSTLSLVQTKNISSYSSTYYGMSISPNGMFLTIGGYTDQKLHQFRLTSAWSIASFTYASQTRTANIQGSCYNPDGSKFWLSTSLSGGIAEYNLPTAYDVSSIVDFTAPTYPHWYGTSTPNVNFSVDGKYIYIGSYQYRLAIPFDPGSSLSDFYGYKSNHNMPGATSDTSINWSNFSPTIYEKIRPATLNFTVTFGTASEEWIISLLEIIDSGGAIGGSSVTNGASNTITTPTGTLTTDDALRIGFFAMDNSGIPFTYNSPIVFYDENETTSGGSGSIGLGIGSVNSTTRTTYSVTASISDGWLSSQISMYEPPAEVSYVDLSVNAVIQMLATVSLIIETPPSMSIASSSSMNASGSGVYGSPISMVASCTMIDFSAIQVTDYRFSFDRGESGVVWTAPLNSDLGFATTTVAGTVLDRVDYYGLNIISFHGNIRFLLKNVSETAILNCKPRIQFRDALLDVPYWQDASRGSHYPIENYLTGAGSFSPTQVTSFPAALTIANQNSISTIPVSNSGTRYDEFCGWFSKDGLESYALAYTGFATGTKDFYYKYNRTTHDYELATGSGLPGNIELYQVFADDPNKTWLMDTNLVLYSATDGLNFTTENSLLADVTLYYNSRYLAAELVSGSFRVYEAFSGSATIQLINSSQLFGSSSYAYTFTMAPHPSIANTIVFIGLGTNSSVLHAFIVEFNVVTELVTYSNHIEDTSSASVGSFNSRDRVTYQDGFFKYIDKHRNNRTEDSVQTFNYDVANRTYTYFSAYQDNTQVMGTGSLSNPKDVARREICIPDKEGTSFAPSGISPPNLISSTDGRMKYISTAREEDPVQTIFTGLTSADVGVCDNNVTPDPVDDVQQIYVITSVYDPVTDEIHTLYYKDGDTTHYVFSRAFPIEQAKPTTQQIGSGTYNSTNRGILRYGYMDDPVCDSFAAFTEVEVSVPFVFSFNKSTAARSNIQLRLVCDNDTIDIPESTQATLLVSDVAGIEYGACSMVTDSQFNLDIEIIQGVTMTCASSFNAVATMITPQSMSISSDSSMTIDNPEFTDVLQQIEWDYRVNYRNDDLAPNAIRPVDTTLPLIVTTSDYDTLFETQSNNFTILPLQVRWWINNQTNLSKTYNPVIQMQIDDGVWNEIDVNGNYYATRPVAMDHYTGEPIYSEITGEYYHSQNLLSTDTLFPFCYGVADYGTYLRIHGSFLDSVDDDVNFTYTYTLATETFSVFSMASNSSSTVNPLRATVQSTGVDKLILSSTDCLLMVAETNNVSTPSAIIYRSDTDDFALSTPSTPGGMTGSVDHIRTIETFSGDLVAIISTTEGDDGLFISHMNSSTYAYGSGSVISLTGHTDSKIRCCAFFADTSANTIHMMFLDMDDSPNFNVYEAIYNASTSTWGTPTTLFTLASVGLTCNNSWTAALSTTNAQRGFSSTVADSLGNTHIIFRCISIADSISSFFAYNDSLNIYTMLNSYINLERAIMHLSFLDGERLLLLNYSGGGGALLAKYYSSDWYYRVFNYRAGYSWDTYYAGYISAYARVQTITWDTADNKARVNSPYLWNFDYRTIRGVIYVMNAEDQDQNDTLQLLSDGPFLSANGSTLTLHKHLDSAVLLPSKTSTEIVATLGLDKGWCNTYLNDDSLLNDTEIKLRLFDSANATDYRSDRYMTVVLRPDKLHEGVLSITSDAVMNALGTKIVAEGAAQMSISTDSVMNAVGTKTESYTGSSGSWATDAIMNSAGLIINYSNGDMNVNSNFTLSSNYIAAAKATLQNTSNMSASATVIYNTGLSINSDSEFNISTKKVIQNSMSISSDSQLNAGYSKLMFGKLNVQTQTNSNSSGVKIVNNTLSCNSSGVLNSKGVKIHSGELALNAQSNFNSGGVLVKTSSLSLRNTSALSSIAERILSGEASFVCNTTGNILASALFSGNASFTSSASLDGSLLWNDNRDIIEFSSNIDRVVEFTLYDNDANFVQEITMSYELDSYIAQVDLYAAQVCQYSNQLLEITKAQAFELDSVELESQRFTGDITREIEYDLCIDRTALYESEIQTTIAYNMQIEKLSDKVIPLGL